MDVLWDAVWQPAAPGVYPDRPASPGRRGSGDGATAAGNGAAAGTRLVDIQEDMAVKAKAGLRERKHKRLSCT